MCSVKKPKGKFIQIIDSSGRIGAKMSVIEGEALPQASMPLKSNAG
jgi:hypothetical protein